MAARRSWADISPATKTSPRLLCSSISRVSGRAPWRVVASRRVLVTRTRGGAGGGGPAGSLTTSLGGAVGAQEAVTQLPRVAPAHLELDLVEHDAAPTVLHPHLLDVPQGDERAAMDPHESRCGPTFLEGAEGDPDEVGPGRGVEAGVVALRL